MVCLGRLACSLFFFFLGAGVWVFAVYDTLVTQETAFAFNGFYILLHHCHQQYLLPTRGIDNSFHGTLLTISVRPCHGAILIWPQSKSCHIADCWSLWGIFHNAGSLELTQHLSGDALIPRSILNQSRFAVGVPESEDHSRILGLRHDVILVASLDTDIDAPWRRQHVEGPDDLGGSQHDRREGEMLTRALPPPGTKAVEGPPAALLEFLLCRRAAIAAAEAVWVLDKALGNELFWPLVILLVAVDGPRVGDERSPLRKEVITVAIVLRQCMRECAGRDGTPAEYLLSLELMGPESSGVLLTSDMQALK